MWGVRGQALELSQRLTWVSESLSNTNKHSTCSRSCPSFERRAICPTQKGGKIELFKSLKKKGSTAGRSGSVVECRTHE